MAKRSVQRVYSSEPVFYSSFARSLFRDARDICRRVALILHSKRDTCITRVSSLYSSVVVDASFTQQHRSNNFLNIQVPATKRIMHICTYIHEPSRFLSARPYQELLSLEILVVVITFPVYIFVIAIAPVLIPRWPPWERFLSRCFTFTTLSFYTRSCNSSNTASNEDIDVDCIFCSCRAKLLIL